MAAIVGALVVAGNSWGTWATLLGGGLALAGAGFAICGLGVLGPNLTPFPSPRQGTTLVDTGPYAVVRHPIYGGLVVGCLGAAFIDANLLAAALSVGLGVLFSFKATVEEAHLREQVAGYSEYCSRVRWQIVPLVR